MQLGSEGIKATSWGDDTIQQHLVASQGSSGENFRESVSETCRCWCEYKNEYNAPHYVILYRRTLGIFSCSERAEEMDATGIPLRWSVMDKASYKGAYEGTSGVIEPLIMAVTSQAVCILLQGTFSSTFSYYILAMSHSVASTSQHYQPLPGKA